VRASTIQIVAISLICLAAVCSRPQAEPPLRSSTPAERELIVCPKIWDETKLATWVTPLAGLDVMPGHYSEEEYYAAPIDNLRTYPVYHPRFEPPGYREWLRAQGPQPLIGPEKARTKAEWIEAGRRAFEELDTAISRTDDPIVIAYFSDAAAIDAHRDSANDAMTKDGVILDYRWVVDYDGKLKISVSSCSGCHSKLMPDGTLLRGAPSNYDLADSPAADILLSKFFPDPPLPEGEQFYQSHGVPWLADDPHAKYRGMSDDEMALFSEGKSGAPTGTTFPRFNGSPLFATRMADLIGVRDRRYLDATGTHANRGPEDIARYGILVEFVDNGHFGPHRMTPELNQQLAVRPADEAMFAIGMYVYSLEPAKSPYPFDELAQRGERIFEREGCYECHTPPVYTNNKLVAVPGFEPEADAPATQRLNISNRRVGTDPGLALKTRKGTGYYKIPSLRGVWYRGLYEHSGSVSSLEDWFDPNRLRDDYVPTGWKGPGVKSRAVPGHTFGHDLPDEDKRALIAFLRTL